MRVGATKDRQPWGAAAGMLFSYMLDRQIRWVGILMYEELLHLECDREVIKYEPNPLTISKMLPSGDLCSVVPHVQVMRPGGNSLVLCKWRQSLQTKDGQTELEVARSWGQMNNHTIEVVTEKELRSGYSLRNVKLLWRHRYERVTKETRKLVSAYLVEANGTATLKDLASAIAGPSEQYPLMQLPLLYNMLFHGDLSADFTRPISAVSKVWVTTETDKWQGRRSPFLTIY